MAEVKEDAAAPSAETVEGKGSILDNVLDLVDATAPEEAVGISDFEDPAALGEKSRGDLVSAALRVFIDGLSDLEAPVEKVDKNLINSMISQIDAKISAQLDEILHHEKFQKLESAWRGLKYVVDRTDFRKNVRIQLLNVSKGTLLESFEDSEELIQSAFYRKVYTGAYDSPGASPFSAIISNYEFLNHPQDIALLQTVSKVSAAAHCPFLGAVGPAFFDKESMEDWKKLPDLGAHLETVDYTKWNSFRDTEDSRYVGLLFPRFMLRLPYGPETVPVKSFNYSEGVTGKDHEKYLWGNASYAFAANMVRAFMEDGWCVQIRGPQSGGRVEDLPVHLYDVGRGKQMKIPTEVPIDETLEFTAAKLGFIPLSIYQGTDYACFFSANSTQRPVFYGDASEKEQNATANARINSRLPYIFLASRIAHYLKVLQRENIGATKDKGRIQEELNEWLDGYITQVPKPSEKLIAKRPLREGKVTVHDIPANPGFYRVEMKLKPHFQIEGMDIALSLVGKIPNE